MHGASRSSTAADHHGTSTSHPSPLMRRVLEANRSKKADMPTRGERAAVKLLAPKKTSREFSRFLEARDKMKYSKQWTPTQDAGCNCGRVTLRCMLLYKRPGHQWDRSGSASADNGALKTPSKNLTDGPIANIFNFYCKLQPPNQQLTRAPKSYDEIRECNSTICLFEFLCFARDFDLVPHRISKNDLQALWRLNVAQHCASRVDASETSRQGMDLAQFMQFLVKVGLCAFSGDSNEEELEPSQEQRLSGASSTDPRVDTRWAGAQTRVTFKDEQRQAAPEAPERSALSSVVDLVGESSSPAPPVSSRRSREAQHRRRQEKARLRGPRGGNERGLGRRAGELHHSILNTLLHAGHVDAVHVAPMLGRLVSYLHLDDPAHVQHVILTKGRATSRRLNNYSVGESRGEENRAQLLEEAVQHCSRAQSRRRTEEDRARRRGPGLAVRRKSALDSFQGATRGLDDFDQRVFGEGDGEDSSDDEDHGGSGRDRGGAAAKEEGGGEEEEEADDFRRRMATPPESHLVASEGRAQNLRKVDLVVDAEPIGAWEHVQFTRDPAKHSEEWIRRFNMMASSPLTDHPSGKQPAMMCLSPRGYKRRNVTNVGIHSHHFTPAQKDALALYQTSLVAFLKPYVFMSKHRFLPLAVPHLDLGQLALRGRYQAHVQIRNTSDDVIGIHPIAKGVLSDVATFVFSGTTSIIPGLWLTLVVEIQPERLPFQCDDVFGVIELQVTISKQASNRTQGPKHALSRNASQSNSQAARTTNPKPMQTIQIPVYFQVRGE